MLKRSRNGFFFLVTWVLFIFNSFYII